jgi:hypothetical protein
MGRTNASRPTPLRDPQLTVPVQAAADQATDVSIQAQYDILRDDAGMFFPDLGDTAADITYIR